MVSKIIKLNSGHLIPALGLGVYEAPPEVTKSIVLQALETGYRHVDSAQYYFNESEVCEAISSWIKKDPIFDTDHGYDLAKKAIALSLERAKNIGYIDLMLIHSPKSNYEKRHGTWIALQEAVADGHIKSIGVSNYNIKHIKELLAYPDLKIVPAVNQVELHPWLTRSELVDYCKEKGIYMEAYSPLSRGKKINDEGLAKIAEKYGKTPAQILINWSLSKGFITLPKTVTPGRLLPNLQAADFDLSEEDVKLMSSWDEYFVSAWDPTNYPLDNEK